jgi:tRNA threonylcarbamoyladenosine biosynthesis protein TsaB
MAADIPVLGVASLDGLAVQCMETTKQVCCVLDARKGQVYSAFYRYDSMTRSMQRQGAIEALTPEELMLRIDQPTVLGGPGGKPYQDLFLSKPMVEVLPDTCIQPRASFIGFLGAEQLQKGDIPPPDTLTPLYTRASEAEINTQKKKTGNH